MKYILVLSAALMMSSVSFGGDKMGKMHPSPTPEMRQKMAEMHQKMSECLKSDKPVAECREQMMKDCPAAGMEGCPMMGKGGMKGMKHKGMRHKKMTE
ncbi:MAG TPA: hypothetical protein DCS07_14065 [Bdellovibrionales bacterium]|nr:MAG: hypothetical protein A2Z97_08310 [Bdellovibrionales bacterium GWB1_52_6]OFZ03005.1 MAG: hypothetical protein A2X97_12155 [Bdellovibrionales bacterium GWA1_52_35]OFZ36380.1 MAG: hypothetical protein A2070_13890 [Bdellovibrionales bacterium GWC1_52_8]HAR43736.1 hypothetical protein [Bdellovibrionales bacterium]HCM38813.1 hypothetical protein [Bdellovibrionales bacterium]